MVRSPTRTAGAIFKPRARQLPLAKAGGRRGTPARGRSPTRLAWQVDGSSLCLRRQRLCRGRGTLSSRQRQFPVAELRPICSTKLRSIFNKSTFSRLVVETQGLVPLLKVSRSNFSTIFSTIGSPVRMIRCSCSKAAAACSWLKKSKSVFPTISSTIRPGVIAAIQPR